MKLSTIGSLAVTTVFGLAAPAHSATLSAEDASEVAAAVDAQANDLGTAFGLENAADADRCRFDDEKADNATMAYLLSRMMVPQFPEVFGVLRNVTHPTHEELQTKQIDDVIAKKGKGDLDKLFRNDDLWVVE